MRLSSNCSKYSSKRKKAPPNHSRPRILIGPFLRRCATPLARVRFAPERILWMMGLAWMAVLVVDPSLASLGWALGVSAGLIGLQWLVSGWFLLRRARMLVSGSLVQIALYGFLFFQMFEALGPRHFQVDRDPWPIDWAEFTIAHIFRASDILDAIDEYGIPIQVITHRGVWPGIALVTMHLAVDFFLIGLLCRWLGRWWTEPQANRFAAGRRVMAVLLLSWLAAFLCCVVQTWPPRDWLLWPIDNFLRTLDVGDVMQIFGYRLHGVPATPLSMAVALFFRLGLVLLLAQAIEQIRLTWFGGVGLTVHELRIQLTHPEQGIRRGAAEALSRFTLHDITLLHDLEAALLDEDEPEVRRAILKGVTAFGPRSRAIIPTLLTCLEDIDDEARAHAVLALANAGPRAYPALRCVLAEHKCSWVRKAAFETLLKIEGKMKELDWKSTDFKLNV